MAGEQAQQQASGSSIKILYAPVGGWNVRDNPEAMDPMDALEFENAISTAGHVEMRKGYELLGKFNDTGNPVSTLAPYDSDGKRYLLMCTIGTSGHGEIYKMDDLFNVYLLDQPIDLDTGLAYTINGDRFSTHQYKGSLLFASLDGVDRPFRFDGERLVMAKYTPRVEPPSIHDLNMYNISQFCGYRNLLFFLERGTSKCWFVVDPGGIVGQCDAWEVNMVANKGGSLVSLVQWSRSGADENQSLLALGTSEGEILVYRGSNPAGDDWILTSKTQVPEIIGSRNSISYADDVAFITKGGIFTLNNIAGSTSTVREQALSDKIRGAVKSLKVSFYRENWQIIYLQSVNWILVNIPIENGLYIQYVCNLENHTWSKFTGINAECFATFFDDAYFGGSDGGVYRLNSSGRDGEFATIRFFVQSSYQILDTPNNKQINELTAYLFSAYRREVGLHLYTDFKEQGDAEVYLIGADGLLDTGRWGDRRKIPIPIPPDTKPVDWTGGSEWNKSYWGAYRYVDGMDGQKLSTPIDGRSGRRISIGMSMEGNDNLESDTVWISSDIKFETSSY